MNHRAPHTHALPIRSTRDLCPLYEAFSEDDDEAGNPIFLFSSFGYISDDYIAYFGLSTSRKYDLTAEEIKDSLERMPDEDVYPEVASLKTTTFSATIDDQVFFKGPKLNSAFKNTGLLPKLLAQEAKTMEILSRHPHANIIQYHGCVVRRGRIVGFILDRYDMTLKQRLDRKMMQQFDVESLMTQIESAIKHLHSLGLAHNDLTPMNIMVDDNNERLVLIDFGSCQPFGSPLITAGTPGWIDEDFTHSAKDHDNIALSKLRSWLHEKKEQE